MYILTSMNNESTQLVKLDQDFEVLYNRVIGGTSNFIPMTGGSMNHHITMNYKTVVPRKHTVKTNYMHAIYNM